MRVCLPTEAPGGATAPMSAHFGSAPTFTIVDTDTGAVEVIENTGPHFSGGEHGHEHGHGHGAGGCGAARLIADKSVHAVICGSIGKGAMNALAGARCYAAASGTVSELVDQLTKGSLAEHTVGCGGRQ
ncbi:MAG: NifB/NifX family molybdenum-iron cluster-binding protein [Spirochaetales bacterium]